MCLFSSSPAEKEIYKYVGGLRLKGHFKELLKLNSLWGVIGGQADWYLGNTIQNILEYKTQKNKIKPTLVDAEFYLLIKKAIYIKKHGSLHHIGTCPKCNKKIYFSVCLTCGFNLLDNHEVDYDELKKIEIKFPTSSNPYNKNQKGINVRISQLPDLPTKGKKKSSNKNEPIIDTEKLKLLPSNLNDHTIAGEIKCINCNKGNAMKLTKSTILSNREVHYCPSCGLTLEKSGEDYKLTGTPSDNKHMETYKGQKLKITEWKRIAKGGLSDKDIELKEKHEKGMNAYIKAIELFKKGSYDNSHSQFSTAKSNLNVSSIECSIASIYCSTFDLVSFNKYLATNPENFHRPTLKSAKYHIGMELMKFNPFTLQSLSKDRYNELIMVIDFITETLLEIPKNNYYNLNFLTHKEKSVAELWKKIAEYTLKIKEQSRIYYLIGCLRTKDESYEDPEPCFKKAIRRASNNDPHIYIEIGDFYSDEMQYFSKATYYYTKAMSFDSMKTAENYKALGSFYGLDGYHEDAVYYFDKGIECPDADFDIYGRKAQSLVQLGRFEEADECFDEFFRLIDIEIKANPRDINLLRAKAVTLASVGERREALDIFLKIEQINPNAEFLQEDLMRLGL